MSESVRKHFPSDKDGPMYSDPKRIRTYRLTFRLDAYEHSLIKTLARHQGEQLSTLVRQLVLQQTREILQKVATSIDEKAAWTKGEDEFILSVGTACRQNVGDRGVYENVSAHGKRLYWRKKGHDGVAHGKPGPERLPLQYHVCPRQPCRQPVHHFALNVFFLSLRFPRKKAL